MVQRLLREPCSSDSILFESLSSRAYVNTGKEYIDVCFSAEAPQKKPWGGRRPHINTEGSREVALPPLKPPSPFFFLFSGISPSLLSVGGFEDFLQTGFSWKGGSEGYYVPIFCCWRNDSCGVGGRRVNPRMIEAARSIAFAELVTWFCRLICTDSSFGWPKWISVHDLHWRKCVVVRSVQI
ncbi:hypothetical protein AVEN_90924-1 [Araneus ventricosus]|uniref:Uncharacterized protein n=1 Tax=Araneus ventricosus TaxID=182803 RepID=A0A4Y2L5B4_ARAVE|nr:hypothetical protein AVEN_90924-1 [Araneus ventricosus]